MDTNKSLDSLPYYICPPKAPLQVVANTGNATDRTSQLGLNKLTPLRVLTPMKLQPGSEIWIQSNHPIRVLHYDYKGASVIHCSQPMLIEANSMLWLLPMARLEAAFAIGWHKLPDELKVRILEANLSFSEAVGFGLGPGDCRPQLCHHQDLTPEIKTLANQVFLTTNMFRLPPCLIILDLRYHRLASVIRRVQFELTMENNSWDSLHRLAQNQHIFADLRHVEIVVNWWNFYANAAMASGNVDISCWIAQLSLVTQPQGSVAFKCPGSIKYKGEILALIGWSIDAAAGIMSALEMHMNRSISFES